MACMGYGTVDNKFCRTQSANVNATHVMDYMGFGTADFIKLQKDVLESYISVLGVNLILLNCDSEWSRPKWK